MAVPPALTEQVLGVPLSVSGSSHPARGNALRVLQVGAGVRLMIYREGLLLAVLLQRALNCSDSPLSSQAIDALSSATAYEMTASEVANASL